MNIVFLKIVFNEEQTGIFKDIKHVVAVAYDSLCAITDTFNLEPEPGTNQETLSKLHKWLTKYGDFRIYGDRGVDQYLDSMYSFYFVTKSNDKGYVIRDLKDDLIVYKEISENSSPEMLKHMKIHKGIETKADYERKCLFDVVGYLLDLSDELTEQKQELEYSERHVNSEGNVFIVKRRRSVEELGNIIRELYEISKSEIVKKKDESPEVVTTELG